MSSSTDSLILQGATDGLAHAADRFRLEALLDVMETGVLFLDAERRVIYCNRAYRRLWGLPLAEALLGESDAALTERTAFLREDDAAYREHLLATVRTAGASSPFDIYLKNGTLLSETSRQVPGPDGASIGRVWLFEDVTAQRAMQARLVDLSERDPLTGLYNSRRFEIELDRLVAEAARRGTQIGLVIFDLDAFKPINDRFGHKAGDEVLIQLAEAVNLTIRRNEQFFRIGGDDFALLVPEAHEIELAGLAKRILAHIDGLVFHFGGEEQRVSASVGISMFPEHALNAEGLLQCAEVALCDVKAGGRHGWGFFDANSASRL